jgi:hypothetical protein
MQVQLLNWILELFQYGNGVLSYTILKLNASALKQTQFQLSTLPRTREVKAEIHISLKSK